jgi:hypothetical protein
MPEIMIYVYQTYRVINDILYRVTIERHVYGTLSSEYDLAYERV